MAFTSADLDALDAAITNEALEVEYDGRRTKFRSMSELLAARAHVKAELAAAAAASSGGRTGAFRFTFVSSRGE